VPCGSGVVTRATVSSTNAGGPAAPSGNTPSSHVRLRLLLDGYLYWRGSRSPCHPCVPGTPAKASVESRDVACVGAGERDQQPVVDRRVPAEPVAATNPNRPLPPSELSSCSFACLSRWRSRSLHCSRSASVSLRLPIDAFGWTRPARAVGAPPARPLGLGEGVPQSGERRPRQTTPPRGPGRTRSSQRALG
jgi:hypothetical protein